MLRRTPLKDDLILTCLRMYCPALPADTGHSDGCAAANRDSSGDGLRPAGADTPGSGVTAGLCQCQRQCYGLQVCMQQRGLSYATHLCPVWFISALPACLYSSLNCMSLSTVCCVSGCPPVFMTVKTCLSRALPLLSKNKCPS